MNNNFAIGYNKIKNTLEENKLINTIVYARSENKDIFKDTTYPVAHINPVATNWTNENVNIFTFEVGIFEQRLKDDRSGVDNVVQNHNSTYAHINDFLTKMSKDTRDQIYLEEVIGPEPFYLQDLNGLDGWMTTITIHVQNNLHVWQKEN